MRCDGFDTFAFAATKSMAIFDEEHLRGRDAQDVVTLREG